MTLTRCAAYARYSTDRQNPLSTQDQLEKCRQYAREHGFQLSDSVYTDEEISGATLERPGLRLLLEAAESRPRAFDVLLLEDASRLSRKQADVLNLCERLTFCGVQIHFVSQGIQSGDEKFQLLLLARGMIDQLFLADTAKRTRRGMEGLIRRGLHTGGRCFGYRSCDVEGGKRLEIFEPEAAIVRQIFELYAKGNSLKATAKMLNANRVQSPRPQTGRLSRSWCPSSVRTILHNPKYVGKIVWGRKQKVRNPKSGRRIMRRGAPPVNGADAPQLRIISSELWEAVCERQAFVKRVYEDSGKRAGLLRTSAMNSPYLFSGLLKCSACGANMQIIAGRGRNHPRQTYGCPMNFHRGDSVCSNRLRLYRDVLERELLAGLQANVLREDVVSYVLNQFEKQLAKELDGMGGEMARMKERKQKLENEIRRLTEGLATGINSPSVMSEIASREQEISEISDRLLSSEPTSLRSQIKNLKVTAVGRMRDLRAYLNTDTQTARAHLAKHVERIEMTPEGQHYIASGEWDLLGGLRWDGAGGQS